MGRGGFVQRLLESKLLLPPLAGYTNHPYRLVLAEFDPPFICTEMVSPHAVIRGSPYVRRMLRRAPGDHLSGVQLVGSDAEAMAEAARILEEMGFDYVDINMGCIVGKVTGAGGGVALMRDEEKAEKVASAVVRRVGIPVTCKIRLGPTKAQRNHVSLTRRLAEAGAAAVTVHGRTGDRKFGEPVDHAAIREAAEAVDIPVVANGGVYTGDDAVRTLRLTGAAAVMPGRGLIGNPWLVPEILATLSVAPYAPPALEERKRVCLRHLRYLVDDHGERGGIASMRRILPKYFPGCTHAAYLKRGNQLAATTADAEALLGRISEDGNRLTYSKP